MGMYIAFIALGFILSAVLFGIWLAIAITVYKALMKKR